MINSPGFDFALGDSLLLLSLLKILRGGFLTHSTPLTILYLDSITPGFIPWLIRLVVSEGISVFVTSREGKPCSKSLAIGLNLLAKMHKTWSLFQHVLYSLESMNEWTMFGKNKGDKLGRVVPGNMNNKGGGGKRTAFGSNAWPEESVATRNFYTSPTTEHPFY